MDSSVLQTAAHFVVGGTPAPEGAWPWMAGLYYLGLYRCGAVLIDNQVGTIFCLSVSLYVCLSFFISFFLSVCLFVCLGLYRCTAVLVDKQVRTIVCLYKLS